MEYVQSYYFRNVRSTFRDVGGYAFHLLVETGKRRPRRAGAYFHFHPDCDLRREGDTVRTLTSAGNLVLRSSQPLRIEDSWYCTEYGLRIPDLAVRMESGRLGCTTYLSEE